MVALSGSDQDHRGVFCCCSVSFSLKKGKEDEKVEVMKVEGRFGQV